MRHKSKNKTRPLFTLSLEMTRLVNETRLLLVPGVNSDIFRIYTVPLLINNLVLDNNNHLVLDAYSAQALYLITGILQFCDAMFCVSTRTYRS